MHIWRAFLALEFKVVDLTVELPTALHLLGGHRLVYLQLSLLRLTPVQLDLYRQVVRCWAPGREDLVQRIL
jgi:hypothetical protein